MGTKERKQKHKEDLRQRILDAARELFVSEGYRSASIRKIAEKIEYSPTAIYFYFKDKAEILDALCSETFIGLDSELKRIQRENLDALDSLRQCMRAYIHFGLAHPSHYLVTFIMTPEEYPVRDELCGKAHNGQIAFNNLRQSVRLAQKEGKLIDGDPEVIAQTIWLAEHGLVTGLISCIGFPFVEPEALIEQMIDVVIEGIRKK
ncbi:MAG: TetR/AcrR family transcriptional regulator [Blastocatellia bacterium]|nr:TetR/AcrR family transcriptional regulator [Blastocatellia bacterium]